ncbi:MAG TPA: hypothetical protein VK745_00755, partial [Polyangiaceae bacterium]|nr:hypothetical protein [Polyangiaceae bacterium]
MSRSRSRALPRFWVPLALASAFGVSMAGAAFADAAKDAPKEVAPQDDYGADIQGDVPGASAI